MSKQVMGPFEIEQRIGVGGMGTVYRALYSKTGQRVALKVLSPDLAADEKLIARFEREVAILKKLRHPHIVRYFGSGRQGAQRYYIMELVDGGSLAELLRERGRLPWEDVIRFGVQICGALEHAHGEGVIHRDLKPGNLLLNAKGQVKLTDFGIARDNTATALTAAGKTVGTFAYMAPEQIQGVPPISIKTDLYALGCVLFELLTGRPPFEAESDVNLLFQHLKEEPPRIMPLVIDCPIWLESLVLQLLEKDPAKRPRDALATQMALREVEEKVARQESVTSHTVSGGPKTIEIDQDATELIKLLKGDKKKRRKKKKPQGPFYDQAWFLALCLLLLIGGVTWALWPPSEEELFASALPLMRSNEPYQWKDAQRMYLEPLLERFPDGEYAEQAREFIEKIEVHDVERQAMTTLRLGGEPKSEAERLFLEAYQFEKFGDSVTALEKYAGLAELLKGRKDDQPYVRLARQHIAAIEQGGTETSGRNQIVSEALDRAAALYTEGKVVEARTIWNSIVTLYASNLEMEPFVRKARARLAGRDEESTPPVEAPGASAAPTPDLPQ